MTLDPGTGQEPTPEVPAEGLASPAAPAAAPDPPVSEPVRYDTAEYQVPATRTERHGTRRFTPVGVFVGAFVVLLLAGLSVAVANFNAGSSRFAWISIALSAGAVLLAVVALLIRSRE